MSKVISRLLALLLSALSHFREFDQSFVFSPFENQLYDVLVTRIWHILDPTVAKLVVMLVMLSVTKHFLKMYVFLFAFIYFILFYFLIRIFGYSHA